jgi:hypothetical protein
VDAAVKRFLTLFVLPVVMLLGVWVWPLVSGERTLVLRDVLQTHLVDRLALGESLRREDGPRDGVGGQPRFPLIDRARAGGQALAGNLNALPFYPDNLLLLRGSGARSTLWALNAHFWLHWLLALGAAFWMGRAFGLSAPAAWMGATAYAFSGYFVSQLNLYNTVAAAALAPALVAAFLETATGKSPGVRRRGLLFAGLLWALLVVGGEPLLALLALSLGAGALLLVAGRRAFSLRLGLALVAGTLLAAPQIVEMLRILPLSFRNNEAIGGPPAIVGSFRAAHLADLLFPFFFGRPSLTEVLAPHQFDGYPPLLFTLYPGLLALALIGAALERAFRGSPRSPAAVWGVGAMAAAVFFTLGRFNPIVEGLWQLPLGRLLHFPAKFWLLGAVGGALLCGLGFEALLTVDRRRVARALGVLLALYAGLLAAAVAATGRVAGTVASLLSPGLPAAALDAQLVRLQGLAVLSIGVLVVALALLRLGGRAPTFSAAALVFLHAATQLWAMLPGLPTDEAKPYLTPPPLLASIPAGSVVMHGANLDLFRPSTMRQGSYPDPRILWLTRRAALELYPFTALQHGLRAELAISPEGLDGFLTQALTVAIKGFSDARRLDVLEALGVDYLLLDRELAPEARSKVREVASQESFGQAVRLYELVDRAREVELATRVIRAPQMNAALEALFDPAFDPHRMAIVPGEGATREAGPPAPAGGARLVENRREEVVVEVDAPADGVLSLRRAFLPLWRVEIDGMPARTLVVQVAHLGVAVPAGRHRVRFWIDRRPLAASLAAAALGALLLALAAFGAGGSIAPFRPAAATES